MQILRAVGRVVRFLLTAISVLVLIAVVLWAIALIVQAR